MINIYQNGNGPVKKINMSGYASRFPEKGNTTADRAGEIKRNLRIQGIEPWSVPWEGTMIPLHQMR